MKNEGRILASDLQPGKLNRLQAEMTRLGVTIVDTRPMDINRTIPLENKPLFDRILIDAPCSGLGVLQKNPDGKWRTTPDDLLRYQRRQFRFLKRCAPFLKPNGILVYSVCSFEPEENRVVIEEFLRNNPAFDIYHAPLNGIANCGTLLSSDFMMNTLPHQHGMDGFFAAALIRKT